jgi:hypothetical protein
MSRTLETEPAMNKRGTVKTSLAIPQQSWAHRGVLIEFWTFADRPKDYWADCALSLPT